MRALSDAEAAAYRRLIKEADAAWNQGMLGRLADDDLTSRDWFAAARALDEVALVYLTDCTSAVDGT